jgi:hypothetical protein
MLQPRMEPDSIASGEVNLINAYGAKKGEIRDTERFVVFCGLENL